MLRHIRVDLLGLIPLLAGLGAALMLVPESPWRHPGEAVYEAVAGTVPIVVLLAVACVVGRRAMRLEWGVLALFLALMPVVYIRSLLHAGQGGALSVEIAGLVVFAGAAVAGLLVSRWFLVIGIAAHGLLWDLWHRHSGFIPIWYADACLFVDVGVGLYAAAQMKRWQEASRGAGKGAGVDLAHSPGRARG